MELDDFKTIIKTKAEQAVVKSQAELQGCMRRQTTSVIGKIKRSLWIELVFALCFIIFIIWFLFTHKAFYTKLFGFILLAFCSLFIVYVTVLYKKINYYYQHIHSITVKESLLQLINILTRFTRMYFQLTMILMPVAFLSGFIVGYLDGDSFNNSSPTWPAKSILFYVAWSLAWSAMMYYFTKWYIKKLYGNYLQNLRNQLQELENG